MKVLVVGGGGREHAMVWKLAQSPRVERIICAPGNAGIAALAETKPVSAEDIDGLISLAEEEGVDLVLVGPEAPLTLGLADKMAEAGLKVFGPQKAAAALEGSKVWAKEFMARHGIPTAPYAVFEDAERARRYLKVYPNPVVIKADGLAAGKGVFVCDDKDEAIAAMEKVMIDRKFGPAGDRLVIEDRLVGEEASFIVVTDGRNVIPFPSSQDHKAAYDGDTGPNTGGMGAYSPAPVIDRRLHDQIMSTIIEPTIRGLRIEGRPFVGFLYAGLMITADGPKVLEFNVRLGDPEAQPLLARLRSDLVDLAEAAVEGRLDQLEPVWDERAAVCVVMAAKGYPGKYNKGARIKGLDQAAALQDVIVFHAGTAAEGERFVTSGGRVLGVTALGEGIPAAIDKAYQAVGLIKWDGVHFRTDIGRKALNRPRVGVVMGSDSDWAIMKACSERLAALGVPHEVRVLSAHRTPAEAAQYAKTARSRGIKVLIAAAGGAAHLAGALAGQTDLPVIGVPINATGLNGLDALLATVQMPPGVPVATVSLDKWGAINAAVLAAQIVGLSEPDVAARVAEAKAAMADKVRADDERLKDEAGD